MRWLSASVLVCAVSVFAEDYLTEGVDNARTGWLKNEKVFTIANVGSMKRKTTLQRGWASREFAAPTAPIVVNDVVFAAASGRPQGSAVLYAFDSRTGRELWNSGKTMTSYVPPCTSAPMTARFRRSDMRWSAGSSEKP